MPKQDIIIYHFDSNAGEYSASSIADLDPIESKPMLPGFATLIPPPAMVDAGKVAVFDAASDSWSQLEDHRGKVYDTTTLAESMHADLGVLPVNLTDLVPIANSAWDAAAKAWAFDAGKAIAERATAINAACAAAIVGGFSSSALGAAYSYDSAIEDQLNLIGATAANIDMPYPCTDSAGVKAEIIHSALQIKTVLDAGLVFKSTQLSKARALKVQLNALSASPSTSQADMDSIIW